MEDAGWFKKEVDFSIKNPKKAWKILSSSNSKGPFSPETPQNSFNDLN